MCSRICSFGFPASWKKRRDSLVRSRRQERKNVPWMRTRDDDHPRRFRGDPFSRWFRLSDQDAFATARGEAFAATADNASAIYYNPAEISALTGRNFRAGIYRIYLPISYDSPDG